MKKIDLAYWAGIFDGEGYVGIILTTGRRHRLAVDIGNTNEWLIRACQFSFGGNVKKYTGKQAWKWSAANKIALRFLLAIRPYAKIKGPQIDVAIQFQMARSDKGGRRLTQQEVSLREAQALLIKSMKRRGGSNVPTCLY